MNVQIVHPEALNSAAEDAYKGVVSRLVTQGSIGGYVDRYGLDGTAFDVDGVNPVYRKVAGMAREERNPSGEQSGAYNWCLGVLRRMLGQEQEIARLLTVTEFLFLRDASPDDIRKVAETEGLKAGEFPADSLEPYGNQDPDPSWRKTDVDGRVIFTL